MMASQTLPILLGILTFAFASAHSAESCSGEVCSDELSAWSSLLQKKVYESEGSDDYGEGSDDNGEATQYTLLGAGHCQNANGGQDSLCSTYLGIAASVSPDEQTCGQFNAGGMSASTMSSDEARNICSAEPACAGFTVGDSSTQAYWRNTVRLSGQVDKFGPQAGLECWVKQGYTPPATPPPTATPECFKMNMMYNPLNMPGQGRSTARSAGGCQSRCASISGCAHFSFWANGGCHVQGDHAVPEASEGLTSGPPMCSQAPEPEPEPEPTEAPEPEPEPTEAPEPEPTEAPEPEPTTTGGFHHDDYEVHLEANR